jgi:hypothetical protein
MPKPAPVSSIPIRLGLACVLALVWCGCDKTGTAPEDTVPVDQGLWILDSNYTLDEFPFSNAACEEVFPSGSASIDTLPSGSVAAVRIVSTACYAVQVRVVDSSGDTVRSFASRFGIAFRSDAEKNRGVPGFVAWDGLDDRGAAVPKGRYLWRMLFDFGSGRLRKFRADILLP